MPCAAGELCKPADVELIAPNGRDCGHECRGECGGKLHGICGGVEDPEGDSPTHRICHTCISNRSLSNSAKRKQGQGCALPHRPGYTRHPCSHRGARVLGGARGAETGDKALAADTEAVLMEKMNDKFTEDSDSDEEEELKNTGEVESVRGRRLMAPPPYTDLSGCFGPLEQFAQSAGSTEAGNCFRKAKMSFLSAHAAKPAWQADMRMFLES